MLFFFFFFYYFIFNVSVAVFENFLLYLLSTVLNQYYIYVMSTPSSPSTPPMSPSVFFNRCCYTTHTCICIERENLPSPFSVISMYMCLGLTAWAWITYRGAHAWIKLILFLPAAVNCLHVAFHLTVGSCEIFPQPVSVSAGVVNMQVLLR